MTVDLSIACWHRDLSHALQTGEVELEGIDTTVLSEYPPKRHRRFFERGDYDVAEVSLASYLSARKDRERYPFTAIPVFPAKRFPHSFFYKRTDTDIQKPADLEGKKVGIQSWQTTRDVWMRGIAREYYDLDLTKVHWYQRKENDVPLSIPDRYDIQPLPEKPESVDDPDTITEVFFDGELDAVIEPAGRLFWDVVESDVAELFFDDPLTEERDYFRETGIHPVLHVIALREEIVEEHPWVAVNLFDGFCEARDVCLDGLKSPARNTAITWNHLHLREQREVLGPDAWEYGLTDRNRREVSKFIEYADNQGLIPRPYDVDELFVDCSVARD
ncbi:substrate-binding domain-containing protein [Halapricum salinum]|uniref:ABC transporter substrate-binding protein n=1 Tax=Halapricum salinum TaxID=1457250 RepID=A0A4D6HBX6_9EURY|nr:4,5-dihydroxyphthalate decarboxylase [Halapricum salinum]QCC50668.1 ABC transporter substrate-binding protein [Halapricum salinum]